MLYVVKVSKNAYSEDEYILYEVYSNSFSKCHASDIMRLKYRGILVENIDYSRFPNIKAGFEGVYKAKSRFTVVGKNNGKYIAAEFDGTEVVYYLDKRLLKAFINNNEIVNVRKIEEPLIIDGTEEDTEPIIIGIRDISASKEFEDKISEKYQEFMDKTRALGMDCGFKYELLDEEVIYSGYTGTSKTVIIPGFVTVIKSKAFGIPDYLKNLKIKMSKSVHTVGSGVTIHTRDIPETVRLVCDGI